ncbi:hypothetical protein B7P43_G10902 [Cryptotermes secundus]|uniref:Mos1 transposase HTH domain-containing protein n=1 Tax=Cryptotermes secundus TaxID=105785 RepID=A0A2J7QS08_9NEOP|nr:hypothetical protein B7P43_G10902 [Cryptotermes secundus]
MAIEQSANIIFCLKLGKTAGEEYNMMKSVYGSDCLSAGDEKHARVEHCKDMLRSAQSDTKFTKLIVTGDEIWC